MTEFTVQLAQIECWVCGCVFAVSWEHNRALRRKGETFYCPRGDRIRYGESVEEQLRKQLVAKDAQIDQARAERDGMSRRLSAARGQITRVKNRVSNGVCPCCNRSFENLRRHMSTKHPDYKDKES